MATAEVRVAIQSCEIEWTFAAEVTTEARLPRLAHIGSERKLTLRLD